MRKNYLAALAFLTALSSASVPAMATTVHADEVVTKVESENTTEESASAESTSADGINENVDEQEVVETQETELVQASSEEYTEGNFKYTVSDDIATITGLVDPGSKTINLVIPAKIGGYAVKNIAPRAFEGNKNIKSVTFADGLEYIGYAAFKNCSNLTGKITIPSTVTKIQGGGNSNENWYADREDEKSGAFYGTSITELVVEDGNANMTIGISAFEKCINLAKVTLPNRVTSLGRNAFGYDTGLASLTISGGKNNVEIGTGAFYNCVNLSEVSLGSGISVIGTLAFYGTGCEKIVCPDTLKTIKDRAFASCRLLTSLELNEGLEVIEYGAFKNCSLLEGTITIPSTVTKIQGGRMVNGVSYYESGRANDVSENVGAFYGTGIEKLVVKDSDVRMSIGISAFENCGSLTSVILPNRVTSIGTSAFENCKSLTDLEISSGSNDVNIGTDAFCGCASLVNVTLGEGVRTLELGAFQLSGVKNIVFPSTLTSIGTGAFYNCSALESISLNEGLKKIYDRAFAGCVSLSGELVIPSTVTSIEAQYNNRGKCVENGGAFYNTNFSSVVVKDGIADMNIGAYTFNKCSELRSASLSNRLTAIGEGAFMNTPLVWVKISNGNHTMTIGKEAFNGCSDLKVISLPKNVTGVGDGAFYNCSSLTDVYYAGTQKQYNALCTSTGDGNSAYTKNATWHYESDGPAEWPSTTFTGWKTVDGKDYWYEDSVLQGTEGRGKEIYDPSSDAWYWLDAIQGGAKAVSKDVYQESAAGEWGDNEVDGVKTGKWVRYDENGHMVKGWQVTDAGTYYFDEIYGTMAKGEASIDGKMYMFNIYTGVMEKSVDDDNKSLFEDGWHKVDGVSYWYEGGVRQGYDADNESYRGKEIYDPESNAWYWLDNVQQGAVAKSKDVYQDSDAGEWGDYEVDGVKKGKWVRYDGEGHMIKGWDEQNGNRYYFDPIYGTMAKGEAVIDGVTYYFDVNTGVLQQ